MSLRVYKRRKKVENDVGKEVSWELETPAKQNITRIGVGSPVESIPVSKNHVLESVSCDVETVGVGSPLESISVSENHVLENVSNDVETVGIGVGVGSPRKQFSHAFLDLNSSPGTTTEGAKGATDNPLPQCDDAEFDLPSPSKKRKVNEKEVKDDKPQRKTKKKTYWPKIDSPFIKSAKKSEPKGSTTPKPSTPKQRKSDARKKVPKCQRSLFAEDSEVSLPFLNGSKNKPCESENFSMKNGIGIQYDSLQSYQEMISCQCLFESRQCGANFPRMCLKKRTGTIRPRLEKFFLCPWPIVQGKRSKSFIRKKRSCIVFNSEDTSTISRKMKSLIKRIRTSKKKKSRKTNRMNAQEKSRGGAQKKSGGELVTYKPPPLGVDVMLDQETLRVWDLLKEERGHEENDEMKQKYWEETRKVYREMVGSFITRMHCIQGDRRFLPWKGSVMDSVVGVFLTQNVADALSSSAYMSLAARFPIEDRCGESKEELVALDSQESIGSNTVLLNPEFDKETEYGKAEEVEDQKAKEFIEVDNRGTKNDSSFVPRKPDSPTMIFNKEKSTPSKKSINEALKQEKLLEKQRYWETLRKIHSKSSRDVNQMDSLDWEAVRCAQVHDIAQAIASRGQHNIIAGRIKSMLNILMESNGSLDLEWLRDIPPKDAKEYLLNIYGIGLKSAECIRLLTLQHCAFPVDVNVGRIAVRLGWVPIQPLPEPIQFHNLEQFPNLDKVQQYLWPRLCTLDQPTLYELHYQMITFGKVFCTKKNPNCNACPMRNECKHFASALASKKLALPGSTLDQGVVVTSTDPTTSFQYSTSQNNFGATLMTEVNTHLIAKASKECEPVIEMPASPETENTELLEFKDDVYEDNIEDIEDLLTVNLSQGCLSQPQDYSSEEFVHDVNTSTTLVALRPDAANIPLPKIKNVSRLKTERLAYVLPDDHPLLAKHTPREPDDPSPYLFVVWTAGELESSYESSQDSMQEEHNSQTVPGTLMIPCRSAMKGRFPLNGTYFQVNEVFADYTSMIHPINAPRSLLWPLNKKIVYFGTAASAIMRGMSLKEIHDVFWNGYICVRAMDANTRDSRPISSILHRSTTTRLGKKDKNVRVNEE